MVDAGIDVALLSAWFSVDKDLKHDKEMALAFKNEGMSVQVTRLYSNFRTCCKIYIKFDKCIKALCTTRGLASSS